MKFMRFIGLTLFVLLITQEDVSAEAGKWLRVESPRFIVYGTADEGVMRQTVQDLEAFDAVLRVMTGTQAAAPANKLPVYLVRSTSDLREAMPNLTDTAAGAYMAHPERVFAIGVFSKASKRFELDGREILFHEYTHHFMMQYFPGVYPAWYVEGFAEFFAPTTFKDDVVIIGNAPDYRVYELLSRPWIPLKTLLTADPMAMPKTQMSQFYGQGWLLTHYLMSDESRRQELMRYLLLLRQGVDEASAFSQAFGITTDELDRALREYTKLKLAGLTRPPPIASGDLSITRMPASFDDLGMLSISVVALRSSKIDTAKLEKIRQIVQRHGDDPFARQTLAWAEIRWGTAEAADALIDPGLAAAPQDAEWLYLKGLNLIVQGERNPSNQLALYRQARPYFVRANKSAPDTPRILFRYASTFGGELSEPSENTANTLYRAYELAPQVAQFGLAAAVVSMYRQDWQTAEQLIRRVAYKPHGGQAAKIARELLPYVHRREIPPDSLIEGESSQAE